MLVRKYRAKDLQQALAKVKADLGSSATVLSSRWVKLGFLSRQLEITAAITSPVPARKAPPPPPPETRRPTGVTMQQVVRAIAPLREEMKAMRNAINNGRSGEVSQPGLKERIDELRHAIAALQSSATAATRSPHEALVRLARDRLLDGGMLASVADALLSDLGIELPPSPVEAKLCIDALISARVAQQVSCAEPPHRSLHRRVIALVGPPGAGKSLTLAKIAAQAALVEGRQVALIGCDGHRMGASATIEAVAEAIGTPCVCASTPAELAAAAGSFIDRELVLIDTAGQSVRDAAGFTRLRELLTAADAEAHLVVSADMRALELDAVLQAYRRISPQSITFTRVDEALAYGGLFSVVCVSDLPLLYLCAGRQIPDDIEVATPQRIAALVTGAELN